MNPQPTPDRQSLLRDIAAISTMQRGTLAEEYRQSPAPDGKGTIQLGPYFKHQCWEAGRNLSRRVPAHEVADLREDLANAKRFDSLIDQLAQSNIEHTRSLRAAQSQAQDEHQIESKKNFKKRAPSTNSKKPQSSSPQHARVSRPKGSTRKIASG
jgi:hypothetical protein